MLLQQLINGISVGGIYALMATGYALVYSLLGFSNWAHGDVAMLGTYIGFLALSVGRMPFWLSAILAIAGAGVISVLDEKLVYKKIRSSNGPTMFLMIAAMGLSITFQNFIIVSVGPAFKMFPPVVPVESINLLGTKMGVLDMLSLVIAGIFLMILQLLITKTRFGLAVRAASSSMSTASLLGINIDKYIMYVFLLAGSLAGVAGLLYAMKYTLYPQMGNVAFKAFIASVFGGLGSVKGAVIGAIVIGILEVLVSAYINSALRDLVTYVLLIGVLLIKPSGLFGTTVLSKS
jgi:branched-chain amino acid transport system permease protein